MTNICISQQAHRILIVCSFIFCFLSTSGQHREIINLQSEWKFSKGNIENASAITCDDASWQTVSIPHDWAISGPFIKDGDGNTAKLPWKGEGWYRKSFQLGDVTTKRIYILFDGVMAFPTVYINGMMAGKWDYGYNSFYLDITPHVKFNSTNLLAVHVDTRQHDSRWYPGAGIYRKVQLMILDPIHVDIWGTFVTTPVIKSNYATVNAISSIVSKNSPDTQTISVEHRIISPSGHQIASKVSSKTIYPNRQNDFESSFDLTDPEKWDVYHGVMYRLVTTVRNDNHVTDVDSVLFGIRSIRFTADDGFYLNDRRVQLKGVNLHHDHGPLGAAFYPRAMERQLEIMKEMGCNAIRTSHNVAAPELLEICDRMGILVFNEIFDKYDRKADFIEHETSFDEFAHRNVKNFITRDRNHPSVFLWSVGNEIGDVQWNINGGFSKLRTMVNYVRKYDHSRPVTLVCDSRNSAVLRHFDYYDVHNWNYGRRYDLARQLEPNKAVIISESASTVSTRGFYELPLPAAKTDFTNSLQVSSYDLNAPEWAEVADDDFMWQQEEHYIAGEFVWTGFDYLGEPTPYNNEAVIKRGMKDENASVSSYFGIVDLVGIPKDRYYLYKSHWNNTDTTIHILPHWNWAGKESQKIPVFVYTNGDCAELFVNGKSYGMKCKKPASQKSIERFRLMWNDVDYEPGQLKAVAYKEGQKLGEALLNTAGDPVEIKLTADRNTITADGMDLSYVLIEALDKNGNRCPLANNLIRFTIKGNGAIAGVGNGDPQSMRPFQSDDIKLFYGKAMLIVRSDAKAGQIEVTAHSKGLKSEKIIVTCIK